LNFADQCRQYNLRLWQCPSFLTVMMGIVTLIVMTGTYLIANHYAEQPEAAALIVSGVTIIVFTIGFLIVRSFSFLAEANQMKTEFVSVATHQLRTPLAALKWSLNILMDGNETVLDKKQREYLGIMRQSNERMIRLVNDLLDVSRIEQGRLDLRPQKFSLAGVWGELILETNPIARINSISLSAAIPEDLPAVWGDPDRTRMVVQNLLDNALKYSKEGGKIEVKISKQGKFLRSEIKDDGVGIPEKQKNQIFQKFFRSDNVKRMQTEGTGLGLFIAKGIVELSGGEIGFESEENRGSVFWFTLPTKSE